MQVDITIKNYRCFQDVRPACISLRDGFTAFVGVNNAGKSTLLKFFYEFRYIFNELAREGSFINALTGQAQELRLPSVLDKDEVFSYGNNRDLEIKFSFSGIERLNDDIVVEDLIITVSRERKNWLPKLRLSNGVEVEKNEALMFTSDNRLVVAGNATAKLDDIYAIFETLSNTLYVGPFRNIIAAGGSQAYFDIQVGQSFVQLWKNFKSGNVRSNSRIILSLTKDIKRIFGFVDLDISTSEKDEALQLFINSERFWLSEIGSGMTQFIVVLANAAIKRPQFILIDEPELNLHPSLQLDFLTTLGSYATKGVLFSTHSIGLARASADQIYSVRKLAEGESEVNIYDATPRLSEFIGEMSFSSYRELGADKILLVEGRTDIKTIQQFLRKLKKDHTVLLISLGGSDFINSKSTDELQEVWRISPSNVFALIDSEIESANAPLSDDRKAFLANCEKIGISCHVLKRRATENYLSDRAVKIIKGKNCQALDAYQKLKDAALAWKKEDNWRIAMAMTNEELLATDLGEFLNSI